ncbi:heme exporter protein CcmB [Fuchsiella alkaliacetigena]|uniref:heme exporter protein CcmB n=1 Tax=Fuchsiella alkaliacetigena TaxID=957042 RepID=UPI00200A9EDF|nr:heme exporter protein CcmB [Fuchsiella alkaliacetigena]MCK8825183.1 heme exporter protein CcmB [Fuchsiella alkaliacetigena]
MDFLKKVKVLAGKDLKLEFRTKEMLSSMLVFSFIVIVVFGFVFDPVGQDLDELFPGIIWVAFIFSGILCLNRSFIAEKENNSLQGLLLCPGDSSIIYFGKLIANLVLMLIMEVISLPLFIVLFDYSLAGSLLQLAAVLFLGSLGFISIGTFLAALTANTKSSEILLPVILFPIIVPVIIGAVEATGVVLTAGDSAELRAWLKLLVVYDLIFIVVPFMLFEFLLEV